MCALHPPVAHQSLVADDAAVHAHASRCTGVDAGASGDATGGETEAKETPGVTIPIARVRRIMRCNPDKKKSFNKESVQAMAAGMVCAIRSFFAPPGLSETAPPVLSRASRQPDCASLPLPPPPCVYQHRSCSWQTLQRMCTNSPSTRSARPSPWLMSVGLLCTSHELPCPWPKL